MAVYSITVSSTQTLWDTFTADSSGELSRTLIMVGENAGSTTMTREFLQRSTGGATPTTQASQLGNTRSPTPTAQTKNWSTLPTLSGNILVFTSVGNKASLYGKWRPPRPWAATYLLNSEQMDYRNSTSSVHIQTEFYSTQIDLPYGESFGRRSLRNGLWHWHTQRTIGNGASSYIRSHEDIYVNRIRWSPNIRQQNDAYAVRNASAGTIYEKTGSIICD